MAEETYYTGSDLKYQITITADGFSQDCDNYDITFYCGSTEMHFNQDDVISRDGKFYLPIPAASLQPGLVKMVITAYVPDSDFPGSVRKEVAVHNLGRLKKIV